jgi:hypothetical protein
MSDVVKRVCRGTLLVITTVFQGSFDPKKLGVEKEIMKNFRGYIPTTILAAALMFGATSVNAGIIVQGIKEAPTSQCTETTKSKLDWGIIVQGLTGIIVQGLTGIIVQGISEESPTNCGIIVQG